MSEPRSEKQFRRMLLQELNKFADACPVESHAFTPGIPDVNVCQLGKEAWLELKFTTYVDKKNPHVRGSQVQWINKRVENDGTVWLILLAEREDGVSYIVVPGSEIRWVVGRRAPTDWVRASRHIFHSLEELVNWIKI